MILIEKLKVRAGKGFSYFFKITGTELVVQCVSQMEKVCTSPVYKVLRKNENENKYGNKSSGSYFVTV